MLNDMIRNQSRSSFRSINERDIHRFTNWSRMRFIRDKNENEQTKYQNKLRRISGTDFQEQMKNQNTSSLIKSYQKRLRSSISTKSQSEEHQAAEARAAASRSKAAPARQAQVESRTPLSTPQPTQPAES